MELMGATERMENAMTAISQARPLHSHAARTSVPSAGREAAADDNTVAQKRRRVTFNPYQEKT